MQKKQIVNILKRTKRKIEKKLKGTKPDTMTETNIVRNGEQSVIWILGTEDYGNLGDHMIAVAQRLFFEQYFQDYQVIEVTARNYYAKKGDIVNNMKQDDIIVGTGGGNLGNQYPVSENIRQDLIQTFPNNRIVIMPQTIWFTQDKAGQKELEKAVTVYGQHKRLLLAVREQYSYNFAKEHFENKILFVPDMVLSVKPYRMVRGNQKTEGVSGKVLICLRKDLETVLSKEERNAIMKELRKEFKIVKIVDTQKDYLISMEKRESELLEFFEELASADLLVTDRLHGMVFAALAETPCIVFDNYNHKVKGIFEWIKELPYIRYKGDEKEISQDIKDLKEISNKCVFQTSDFEKRFSEFAKNIREM